MPPTINLRQGSSPILASNSSFWYIWRIFSKLPINRNNSLHENSIVEKTNKMIHSVSAPFRSICVSCVHWKWHGNTICLQWIALFFRFRFRWFEIRQPHISASNLVFLVVIAKPIWIVSFEFFLRSNSNMAWVSYHICIAPKWNCGISLKFL